jgi:hypothetical protein
MFLHVVRAASISIHQIILQSSQLAASLKACIGVSLREHSLSVYRALVSRTISFVTLNAIDYSRFVP